MTAVMTTLRENMTFLQNQRYTLRVEASTDIREALCELATTRKWTIRELHLEQPSLEDVFVELTSEE